MHFLLQELRQAVPLIFHGNPYLWSVIGFTLEIAALSTATALVIGLPAGLLIGLGHFRGRRLLAVLANAGLALPPVLVGAALFVLSVRSGPLTGLNLVWTKRGVWVAQSILAIPYVTALSAAAVGEVSPGLLSQASSLGASRAAICRLALAEARTGVLAAVLAGLGTCLSEVAAIAILGGNIYGYDQTLASAALFEANGAHYDDALALAIVLAGLILVVMGGLGWLQQSGDTLGFRVAPSTPAA